ncbi:MAG: siroheme synthase [Bacilli bacterium]|nr:siroheme synthase [Bacilli bacterium]
MSRKERKADEKEFHHDGKEYYPMWVDLSARNCVVVGGGLVAERKIASLLAAKAFVRVVSPEVTEIIADWIHQSAVTGVRKNYESGDGDEAFLVIAATNSAVVNEQIYQDCLASGQLINRVDHPEKGNFIVPAIVHRGKLAIAVSTSGASPALAAEICNKLEGEYGLEYEVYLDFLAEFRLLVKAEIHDAAQRRRILQEVLQSEALAWIRNGEFALHKDKLVKQLLEMPDVDVL